MVQGIAVLGGLLGGFWFYCGILFFYSHVSQKDGVLFLMFPVLFMLMGAFLVYVAFSLVRSFSARSVKLFCGTLAFFLYGIVSDYCIPYMKPTPIDKTPLFALIFLGIPLLAAIAFYFLAKSIVFKLTKTQD